MAKQLGSVAALGCMMTFLMLFNFAFFCTGLIMLVAGVYMKIQMHDFGDLGSESGGAVLLAVACLGGLVVVVSISACCCTGKQHPALLYTYGGFLAVIALLEIAAGGSAYAFRSTLIEGFDRGLNDTMSAYGIDKTKTIHVDLMQKHLHCCGSRFYTDWQKMIPPKNVPSSCCRVGMGECDPTDTEDLYTEGCYNRVLNFILSNVGIVAGGALGVAVFPIVGVVLSCCLASYINKVNYEQIA